MAQRLALRSGGRQTHAFDFRRGKVEFKADIVVLGAGMVGVSAALHLQQRGRDVILVDKHELAGEETSYGNAGLIERASVFPYMFPRDFGQILRYALNRAPQVRYAVADLPEFLPWLVRYYLASSPERALHSALAELPLIRRSLIEHEALIAEAGVPQLLRKTGWIKLFRSEATLEGALRDRDRAKQYGVEGETLDAKDIAEREPALTGDFAGGIYWPTPGFVPDPGGLAKAYAALFARKGGRFLVGDARTLEQRGGGWRIAGANGAIVAREIVVALGPWSDQVFRPLGYSIPLAVKRGYHLHLAPRGNAVLNHPVLDPIRLSAGADESRPPQVRYAVADLPVFLPWLVRYYLASSPERALHSALAELPLIRRSLIEHEALIAEAGVPQLLRKTGWIKLFRSEATLANALRDRDRAKQYGVEGEDSRCQ